MPTSQSQLVEVLKEQITALAEPCPGYRAKVAETLAHIISFESKNRIRKIDIRQEVKRECLALGDFLAQGLTAMETTQRQGEHSK